MPDVTPYIPAFNGEEIVLDLCAAVAEKLRSDCNLREIDGYAGGYKAKVTIHIEAFGLDTATVDYTVETNETGPGQDAEHPIDLTLPDTLIDTELEIPLETDLSVLRQRSGQPTPDFEIKPVEITSEGPVAAPQGRKYSRRLKALGMPSQATGGATGPLEE